MRKLLSVLPALMLCAASLVAQSPYSVTLFNPVTMTATNQTSSAIVLGQKQGTIWKAGSYAAATITLTGSSLTTATFGVTGSSDGGVTYAPIAISAILTPGTASATTTATAAGLYQVNLAGLTHVKFVTSGTFTATSITITLTASPNATIGRSSGGPAGGCSSGTTTNLLQGDGAGGCSAARLAVNGSGDTAVVFTNEGWSYRTVPGNTEIVWAQSYPSLLAGLVGLKYRTPSNGFFCWLNGGANSYAGSQDTCISRLLAGVISIDDGTPGDSAGGIKAGNYQTGANCSSTASPAVCGAAPAGKVQVAAAATTLQVNTTAITANSECSYNYSVAGITAPANIASLITPYESARTAGTSFTITLPVAPTTNPVNVMYSCVN